MMGYFTNDIAKESKSPAKVSLSQNPNFIQFESKTDGSGNVPVNALFTILSTQFESIDKATITISELATPTVHVFKGTLTPDEVDNTTFLISSSKAITAENIRTCFLKDAFFKNNFQITIPPKNENGVISNGEVINIKSNGSGLNYSFGVLFYTACYSLSGITTNTTNEDTIDQGAGNTEIELEVYSDTGVFLGVNDTPDSSNMGTYLITLSKSYHGRPIWFDVNSIASNRKIYSTDFLNSNNWCDSGTTQDFRLVAKKYDGVRKEVFYISNVIYTITGYNRTLEQNNLSDYIYNTSANAIFKPLTKQPTLTHIKGQKQYFNFILEDSDKNNNLGANEYSLGIIYDLYTQSGEYIDRVQAHTQSRKLFNIANTVQLNIDEILTDNTGIVNVYLHRSGTVISEAVSFRILPEYLYKVKDFVFLNSLGGWSSFNFGGTETTDFKSSATTIFKTQTPEASISSEIESVYSKEITEQFTVQTNPINSEVCDWLKEISTSIAVFELSTKRYIVVDELAVKHNSKDELFRLEMKYHYSDSYNSNFSE